MAKLLAGVVVLGAHLAESTTLREAAKNKGVFMGSAVSYGYMQNNWNYGQILGQQYDLVTAENACKWSATEPNEGQFDFEQCDFIYNYAVSNNQTFRGHNLCWGVYNPSWLDSGNYSPDEKKQLLKTHIETVMQHYGNNAYAWDVVNEAIKDDASGFKENVWYPDIPDYVEYAFEIASQQNTKAKLFYNDYNIIDAFGWDAAKANKVYEMIVSLKNKGIQLDGIGIQAHLNMGDYSSYDSDSVRNMFQKYQDLGMDVHITELDIACGSWDSNQNRVVPCSSYSAEIQEQQADFYTKILKDCLAYSNCKNFETWGYTDKYTWLGTDQYPLPFDTSLNPKQVVNDMISILQS